MPTHALGPSCRVLLIEDHAVAATLGRQTLQHLTGCQVDWVSSLAQARQALGESPGDYFLAVADLNLEDGQADDIIALLKSVGVPAVAVTASFDKQLRARLLSQGLVDYVLKDSAHCYRYVADLLRRLWRNRSQEVLVVDDSRSSRALLASWLERLSLTVHVAAHGKEALQCLEAHPQIRLVLTDFHMPQMDGFDLVKAIRRTRSQDTLALVGLSSSLEAELSARFIKLGANDFLHKPFSYEELCARVHQNLNILDAMEALRDQAWKDALTGLFNRRYFFEQGSVRLDRAAGARHEVGLAMLDIDWFKRINDGHGHAAGDAVLRQLAGLLTEHFGDGLVARLGGEEFALMLRGEPAEMLARLRSFLDAVALTDMQLPAAPDVDPAEVATLRCTVSMGLCMASDAPLEALLRRADEQLYLAKSQGRNRVCSDLLAS